MDRGAQRGLAVGRRAAADRLPPGHAIADGDHAVAVYRARGRRLGRELDIEQVLVIALRDGRWQEVLALPTDSAAFEAFWAE